MIERRCSSRELATGREQSAFVEPKQRIQDTTMNGVIRAEVASFPHNLARPTHLIELACMHSRAGKDREDPVGSQPYLLEHRLPLPRPGPFHNRKPGKGRGRQPRHNTHNSHSPSHIHYPYNPHRDPSLLPPPIRPPNPPKSLRKNFPIFLKF